MNIDSLRSKERDSFLRMSEITKSEARELLQELSGQCENVRYEEDYAWISEAVIRWESYLKSRYDELYLTPLAAPKRNLEKRLADTGSVMLPLYRPLLPLFAHFILTEPSSERVATMFASLVSRFSEGAGMPDAKRKKAIKELVELARPVRHSLRPLAMDVMNKLDDKNALRTRVKQFLSAEKDLPGRIHATFKSNLEKLGIVPKSSILIYGYSELMKAALTAVPDNHRKDIKVFASSCRFAWQRADGPLVERLSKSLGFETQQVGEGQIANVIEVEKPATILMGCRSIGTKPDGSLEANTLQGSGKISAWASENGSMTCILLGKRKIMNPKSYRQRTLPIRTELLARITTVSSRWVEDGQTDMPSQDRIPGEHIDYLITEDGLFAVSEFTSEYEQKLFQQS